MNPNFRFNEIRLRLEDTIFQGQCNGIELKTSQQDLKNVKTDEIATIFDSLNNMKNVVFLHPIERKRKMAQSPNQKSNRISEQNQEWKELQKGNQRRRYQDINSTEEVKLSHLGTRSPLSLSHQSHKTPKTQTQVGKQTLSQSNKQLDELRNEIKKHQYQKVEYEEQIYELKMQRQLLRQQNKKLKQQLNELKEKVSQKEIKVQQQKVKIRNNQQINCLRSQERNKRNVEQKGDVNGLLIQDYTQQQKIQLKQNKQQHDRLQQILKDFQAKVAKYQKQLTKKQALHNHQHYLLQKLKNQHQQLHLNQNALLQELQYVLKKNKKLKKQNQELKQTDEKRVLHLMELEESNARLMHDIKELFGKINQLEREKSELDEHLVLITCEPMRNRLNFNQVSSNQDIQITKVKNVDQNTKQSQTMLYQQNEAERVEQQDKLTIKLEDQLNQNEDQSFFRKQQWNHEPQPQKQIETKQICLKLSI